MISKIARSAEGLNYISETDAPFEYVELPQIDEVALGVVASAVGIDKGVPVAEIGLDKFFARLVENKEWFGPQEIDQAKKFRKLKDILEKELTDIKVFRFGKIRIDIFILGKNRDGRVVGLRTFSVET